MADKNSKQTFDFGHEEDDSSPLSIIAQTGKASSKPLPDLEQSLNGVQTVSKRSLNEVQTVSKSPSPALLGKPIDNGVETVLKRSPISVETVSKNNGVQSESERSLNGVGTVSKRRPEQGRNGVETESNQGRNGVGTVSKRRPEQGLNGVGTVSERRPEQGLNGVENFEPNLLIGRERQLLSFLVSECQRVGSLTTEPLTLERMTSALNASNDAVKTAIKRLTGKQIILRTFRKNGRSGWVQYGIPKVVYEKMIFLESAPKRSLNSVGTVSERRPEQGPERGLKAPYSSSNDLNINTNTIGVPENLRNLGISPSNLQRLVEQGKCTLEQVTQSLEALSFDVTSGKKGNLASILFGVLNRGGEYVSQNYAQHLQKEIDEVLKRQAQVEEAKRKLAEAALIEKWEIYKSQNPTWIAVYRAKFGPKMSEETLEQFAYGDFKKTQGQGN